MLRLIISSSIKIVVSLSAINNSTEKRGIIAVVDTGLSESQIHSEYICKFKQVSLIDSEPTANYSQFDNTWLHGKNVISLISNNLDSTKYCILSVKVFDYSGKTTSDPDTKYIESLDFLNKVKNLVGVNLSLNGQHYSSNEDKNIAQLLNRGVKVIVSAGNTDTNLSIPKYALISFDLVNANCPSWPACLKQLYTYKNIDTHNLYIVGTNDGSLSVSNQFEIHKEEYRDQGTEEMTGTSQAAANFTGKLFGKKEVIHEK